MIEPQKYALRNVNTLLAIGKEEMKMENMKE